jgi:hypothetical protein
VKVTTSEFFSVCVVLAACLLCPQSGLSIDASHALDQLVRREQKTTDRSKGALTRAAKQSKVKEMAAAKPTEKSPAKKRKAEPKLTPPLAPKRRLAKPRPVVELPKPVQAKKPPAIIAMAPEQAVVPPEEPVLFAYVSQPTSCGLAITAPITGLASVDGKVIGETPIRIVNMCPGRHVISIAREGQPESAQVLFLHEDEERLLVF